MQEFGGQGFGVFKPALADLTISVIAPLSQKMNALLEDEAEIDKILIKGAVRARKIAGPILADMADIIGFVAG